VETVAFALIWLCEPYLCVLCLTALTAAAFWHLADFSRLSCLSRQAGFGNPFGFAFSALESQI